MSYRSCILIFLTAISLSCTKTSDLGNLNTLDWKSDENGCQGKRLKFLPELSSVRENLMGQTQNEIIQLLGKPDHQEIYKRSQKFFTYYISGNDTCKGSAKETVYLQIRFNALGNSNEVLIVK